jgi:hypothetical protein
MKLHKTAAVVFGLAMYVVAFYAVPMPSIRADTGRAMRRFDLLWPVLLRPDDTLLPRWFGVPAEFTLADRLPVLLVAGVIMGWATVVGWVLMCLCRIGARAFWPRSDEREGDWGLTRLESFVFSAAVGLNALSTWMLLLGLCGVMDRLWVVVVPAVVTLAVAGYVWKRRDVSCSCKPTGCSPWASHASGGENSLLPLQFSACWLWLALPFVLMIVLAGMVPPLDFDVCEYHLQAPKEFFQQGQIGFVAHNVYANMAMGTEMLSLLAMIVSGDWWLGALAGKTVIAMFTPLTALALLTAGRRWFSPAAGIVAVLVYLSIPWIVSIASGGFVEGASACYLFLAVYAVILWRQQRNTCFAAMAGYLAGAAVATKYPAALFVLLPLLAWVVWRSFGGVDCQQHETQPKTRRASPPATRSQTSDSGHARCRFLVQPTLVFLLAAALGCGLWFGKNWVLSGNPTYPLLYEVFGGKTWTAVKERQWNRVHRPHDFSGDSLAKNLGRVVLTSEWLSPLVVPLAVLVVLVPWGRRSSAAGLDAAGKSRASKTGVAVELPSQQQRVQVPPQQSPLAIVLGLPAYIGFVIAVWWLLTHRIDRFWIPVLPVSALLAGVGACWSSEVWWRRLLPAILVVGMGANFLIAAPGQGNAWFVSLDKLRNDPAWIDPWHEYFNSRVTQGRLLLVGDAAVFDLNPPVLYNTCFDDCVFEQLVKDKTAAEVRAELAARQITYVYANWGEIIRYRRTYGFTDFVRPEVFDRLVDEGVLEALPAIKDHPGRGYKVKGEGRP